MASIDEPGRKHLPELYCFGAFLMQEKTEGAHGVCTAAEVIEVVAAA
jgi:hypothetical protein